MVRGRVEGGIIGTFPDDPDELRDAQEAARKIDEARRALHRIEEARTTVDDILADYARMQELGRDPLGGVSIGETQRKIEEALGAIRGGESFDIARYSDSVSRAIEEANRVLGPEGIEAALQLELPRLDSAEELQRAMESMERIRGGGVAEILEEATALAASPWVREAIGQADRDTLVRRAERPPSRQESTEPIGSALPPTVRAELALLTTEQLQAFRHYALQTIGLLVVTLSTAAGLKDPAFDIQTLSVVSAALYALLQMVDAELKYQAERDPEE